MIASPLLAVKPSVITTHGLHLSRRTAGTTRQGVRLGIRSAVASSDVVIATSQSELEELSPIVRRKDRAKLRVILNGAQRPLRLTDEQRQAIRTALGVEAGTVLGLFAGELESRKNPLLAAAAAASVRNNGIPFALVFAGDGSLAAALQAYAGPAVRPLGYRDDLNRLMAAADVFVQPSSREGMSLALLDAMSHGLAVVAADAPGNAEAIGDAGLSFTTGDELALITALTAVCTDHKLRRRLAETATARASNLFDSRRFATETAAAYRDALGSNPPLSTLL